MTQIQQLLYQESVWVHLIDACQHIPTGGCSSCSAHNVSSVASPYASYTCNPRQQQAIRNCPRIASKLQFTVDWLPACFVCLSPVLLRIVCCCIRMCISCAMFAIILLIPQDFGRLHRCSLCFSSHLQHRAAMTQREPSSKAEAHIPGYSKPIQVTPSVCQ